MNTLLIIGADGWLGNAIKQEINKEFLDALDIKQIIMHQKFKKVEVHKYNKNLFGNVKLHTINGDFLIQETFNDLNNLLKKKNIKNLFVIVTLGIIHPTKYNQFKKINFNAIKKIYKICSI